MMRRMNSMLLRHQGESARTDCMYFSIASFVAGSFHDKGSQTVRLSTSMSGFVSKSRMPSSSCLRRMFDGVCSWQP
jgi:hypothetical protein